MTAAPPLDKKEGAENYNNIQIVIEKPEEKLFVSDFTVPLREEVNGDYELTANVRTFDTNWTVNRALLVDTIDIPIRVASIKAEFNPAGIWYGTQSGQGDEVKWAHEGKATTFGTWWYHDDVRYPNDKEYFRKYFLHMADGAARFEAGETITQEMFYERVSSAANGIYNNEISRGSMIYDTYDDEIADWPEGYDHPNDGNCYRTIYQAANEDTWSYMGYMHANDKYTQLPVFGPILCGNRMGMTMLRVLMNRPCYLNKENAEEWASPARANLIIVFFFVDMIGKQPFSNFRIDLGNNQYYSYIETDPKRVEFANVIGIAPDILTSPSTMSLIRRLEMNTPWVGLLKSLNLNEFNGFNHNNYETGTMFCNISQNITFDVLLVDTPIKLVYTQFLSQEELDELPPYETWRPDANRMFLNKLWTQTVVTMMPRDDEQHEPIVRFVPSAESLFYNDTILRPLRKIERVYYGSPDGRYYHDINIVPSSQTWWWPTPLTPWARADFHPYGYEMTRYHIDNFMDAYFSKEQGDLYGDDILLYLELDDELETFNYVNGSRSNVLATLQSISADSRNTTPSLIKSRIEDLMVFMVGKQKFYETYPERPQTYGITYPEGYVYVAQDRSVLFNVTLGKSVMPLQIRSDSGGRESIHLKIRNMFGFPPTYVSTTKQNPMNIIHFELSVKERPAGSQMLQTVNTRRMLDTGRNLLYTGRPIPRPILSSQYRRSIEAARRRATRKVYRQGAKK